MPSELFDFAYMGNYDDAIQRLAEFAENEDWSYISTTSSKNNPILYNYILYTFKRLSEESKISINDNYACFDTGLMTSSQEPIYAFFDKNNIQGQQKWHFKQWARKGESVMNNFSILPEMAHYFETPEDLVYDTRLELRENIEHIIEENKDRFPEPFKSMNNYQLQTHFKGALDNAIKRVKRNYKTAIPQYYNGKMQLLFPICLSDPTKADIALTIEKHNSFYRAATIITLDMAYNNARLIAKPDKDWLQP
jgi:hypothetical protein